MTDNVSGFGTKLNVIASSTFPSGFIVTKFADDADPFDSPAITIADKAMGANGDLIVWNTASPIDVTINVIPDSVDDKNLSALAEANRVSKGKTSANDTITMVRISPNGDTLTLTNGAITTAVVATSIASSSRKKTKPYTFTFESKAES